MKDSTVKPKGKAQTQKAPVPYTPPEDPARVAADPVNGRVLDLFDGLRRRGLTADKSAYVVADIWMRAAAGQVGNIETVAQQLAERI